MALTRAQPPREVCSGKHTAAAEQFSLWENEAEMPALTAQMSCSCPMALMKRGQVRSESPLSVTIPQPRDTSACHCSWPFPVSLETGAAEGIDPQPPLASCPLSKPPPAAPGPTPPPSPA